MRRITVDFSNIIERVILDKRITRGILFSFGIITIVFGLCWWLIDNDQLSSWDPPGSDVELQDQINRVFPQRNHVVAFLLESNSGNVFEPKLLKNLYSNELELRREFKEYLVDQYDFVNDRQIFGIFTIADAVQKTLRNSPERLDIYTASDDDIRIALLDVLSNDIGGELSNSMSTDLRIENNLQGNESWVTSAMTIFVSLDNEMLGGGRSAFSLSSDPKILDKETINREVQRILRGQQKEYSLWGLAIDTNLEALDEGQKSIPYVLFAVFLVTLVAAISLRSVLSFGVIGIGLITLLVWLEGISNILFLKQSVTTDLIVPIAMVSLGVDFFIHSVSRYQEGKKSYLASRSALSFAIIGISGALTLAMLSDGIAFLANLTSNIDAVVGFGFSAGVAVVSSYLVMGWIMPVLLVELEEGFQKKFQMKPLFPVKFIMQAVSVLFSSLEKLVLSISLNLIKRPRIWVLLFASSTSACVLISLNIQPEFDIKDFFASDSDLVIGLDKLDEHMDQDLLGEPIFILAEVDTTSDDWIEELMELKKNLRESRYLTKTNDGELFLYLPSLDYVIEKYQENRYAMSLYDEYSGGVKSSQTLLEYLYFNGVMVREGVHYFEPDQIQEILQPKSDKPEEFEILLSVGALGTREQSQVPLIKKELQNIVDSSNANSGLNIIGVTGSPFIRSATLTHTTGLMKISVPVAIIACLIVLLIWMRSALFAVATVIPVAFAVFWILAFMVIAGLNVNFVTATIASVTIGVGIDFSIHITQRFRQELQKGNDPILAMTTTIEGTGKALLGSALSSMIGFSVMLLAPMPIIATYGLLTTIMILIATLGALFMLPSVLMLCESARKIIPR
ncbi:MAG: RND family transporter [Dehalococcoidia bacterium]|tara:strand:+ start:7527 stop:10076 length:2550 start_codon:yes stop_codon:yes gene_type:complete